MPRSLESLAVTVVVVLAILLVFGVIVMGVLDVANSIMRTLAHA